MQQLFFHCFLKFKWWQPAPISDFTSVVQVFGAPILMPLSIFNPDLVSGWAYFFFGVESDCKMRWQINNSSFIKQPNSTFSDNITNEPDIFDPRIMQVQIILGNYEFHYQNFQVIFYIKQICSLSDNPKKQSSLLFFLPEFESQSASSYILGFQRFFFFIKIISKFLILSNATLTFFV